MCMYLYIERQKGNDKTNGAQLMNGSSLYFSCKFEIIMLKSNYLKNLHLVRLKCHNSLFFCISTFNTPKTPFSNIKIIRYYPSSKVSSGL